MQNARPAPSARPARRTTRGSATAETAVALPALVVVLAVCVWALSGVALRLRCAEAARAAARSAARGDTPAAAAAAARRTAGSTAAVTVRAEGSLVHVTVAATLAPRVPLLGRALPRVAVTGTATAAVEPAPYATAPDLAATAAAPGSP